MNKINIPETAEFLENCEDVHILIHRSPDGDCIGAGYSLQAVLKSLGKRAKVLCADEIPERFDFLKPEKSEISEEDFIAKTIISVDVADTKLLGNLQEIYSDKIQLCIDHHVSNKCYAEKLLLEENASATCEILYKLYRYMNIKFTEQIAKCLFTGMSTDTGCFKFENTTPETHIFTAELMREFPDIRYGLINRQMFDVKSPSRIKAEILMLNQMEYYFNHQCTIVWATLELCQKYQVDEKDMEGLTSLSLQPEGVEVGITFREREPNVFKVSMRSAKDVNVSEICQIFGGGGHVKAAGCLLKGSPDEVRKKVLQAVENAL
ncbi:MAG: bifunctional oligoribonuclease/PAP phosphatase NrnA [Oscillospiraceae bacterium]|nr:bifunctional oligoribonuclease/PAP phosphatase NrnA [Oscillospiraceae bacterium]